MLKKSIIIGNEMSPEKLLKIYDNSERIPFDRESKVVVISDVHRGDGSYADSLMGNKNIYVAALNYYYKENFTLIEVGDGDELWKNSSFRDIAYNYKDIFQMLNKFNNGKRLHMIYGNHDGQKKSKEYLEKQKRKLRKIDKNFGEDLIYLIDNIHFKESLVLRHEPTKKEIFITHGHQLDFMNYEFANVSKFLVRYVWRFMEGIGGFKAPSSPANNYKKGGMVDEKLDNWSREYKKLMICGHTHRSRFPKLGEGLYFNDGCCVLPYSISTIEINGGLIALVKWTIEVRENDSLFIKRNILGGPERVEEYLKYVDV